MSSSSVVRLRPARDADGTAIRAIVFGALEEHGLVPDPDGTDADLDDVDASYAGRGGRFDVLEDEDGTILGCVGLLPIDGETCELRKMYLSPRARGRGFGKRLLEAALDGAGELGFRRVVLETARVLERATALYERYGFRPRPLPAERARRCDAAFEIELESRPVRPTERCRG